MSILSLRTRRRRENWAGLPVDADPILGCVSPSMSLAPGLDLEGSRTVASSTPVRISVPSTDAPGQPFCRLPNRLEDKGYEDAAGRDTRR
jgi:hypothetical protein